MHNFDWTLREDRNNEQVADFKSYHSDLMLITGFHSIVYDAPKLYTSKIFKEVKNNSNSSILIVFEWVEVEDRMMLKLTKICDTKYKDVVSHVLVNLNINLSSTSTS